MENTKRERSRAIIMRDGKMVAMYREKDGRVFYTFPGGGMEGDETEVECVKREAFEEFGLTVNPIKKVYDYENEISIEHFYICEWISGEVGDGAGEEYQADRNKGVYIQSLIDIEDLPNLPLMPPEVADAFYNDYMENGEIVRQDVLFIVATMKR